MNVSTIPRVRTSTGAKTGDFVPSNYAEMFDHYYGYIRALVVKAHIDYQDVDDVSMSILTKFCEKDVLKDFDPHYHADVARKALFRTFLSGFVLIYLRHYVNRQWVNQKRELLYLDIPDPTTSGSAGESWGEHSGLLNEAAVQGEWDASTLVQDIRKRLLSEPAVQKCPLQDLFDECVRQISTADRTNVDQLAETFGISATTVRTRLRELRAIVGEVIAS